MFTMTSPVGVRQAVNVVPSDVVVTKGAPAMVVPAIVAAREVASQGSGPFLVWA